MIELQHESIDRTEWAAVVSRFKDLSLLQTWEYGEASQKIDFWRAERMIFRDGERIIGAAQALTRTVPVVGGGVAWVNRGPLWRRPEGSDPKTLSEIMKAMRRYWVDRRGLYLRVAPPLKADNKGFELFPPSGYTSSHEGRGWSSARLDLSGPVEATRAKLDKRWRNSLSSAERGGLVLGSNPTASFDLTLEQFRKLLGRKAYPTTVTPAFLRCLKECSGPGLSLYAFSTDKEGRFIGGIMIVRYGDVAEYLVSAIDAVGRTANAGQFLLWKAVCRMKEAGCRWFDLGGTDPDATPPGVLRFKSGLNPEPYTYVGEFEARGEGLLNSIVRWGVRRARKKVS